MKQPDILYAAVDITHTGNRVSPKQYPILGSNNTCFRIPLGETIEDAILFAYPHLKTDVFYKRTFKIFVIEVKRRYRIIKPSALTTYYGLTYAADLNEYASFGYLRMESLGMHAIYKKHVLNEDVVVLDKAGRPSLIGVRYKALLSI